MAVEEKDSRPKVVEVGIALSDALEFGNLAVGLFGPCIRDGVANLMKDSCYVAFDCFASLFHCSNVGVYDIQIPSFKKGLGFFCGITFV